MSVELLHLGLSHREKSSSFLLKLNPGRENTLVPIETITALMKVIKIPFLLRKQQ